jgi:hypothetical protein
MTHRRACRGVRFGSSIRPPGERLRRVDIINGGAGGRSKWFLVGIGLLIPLITARSAGKVYHRVADFLRGGKMARPPPPPQPVRPLYYLRTVRTICVQECAHLDPGADSCFGALPRAGLSISKSVNAKTTDCGRGASPQREPAASRDLLLSTSTCPRACAGRRIPLVPENRSPCEHHRSVTSLCPTPAPVPPHPADYHITPLPVVLISASMRAAELVL